MIEKVLITDPTVIELIRSTMPVATQVSQGLMSPNELIYVDNLKNNNLEHVGSSFGYSYGTEDGSEIFGPFLSLKCSSSMMQFKSSFRGNVLKLRVFNPDTQEWSSWKSIQLA